MPNWCSNSLTLKHDKEKIDLLEKQLRESDVFFQHLRPRPADQDTNWYEWNVENWGTKWDVNTDGMEFEDHGDGTATLHGFFDSAWAPPIAAFEQLAQDWDSCYIELTYFEPGMAFCGEWNSEGLDSEYEIDPDDFDSVPEHLREEFAIEDWFDSGEDVYEEDLELKEE